jgi:hypothetical protein
MMSTCTAEEMMSEQKEIKTRCEKIEKMMSTIDSYVSALELGYLSEEVTLAGYISTTFGCDQVAAEEFVQSCLCEEMDNIQEDTAITTLSKRDIERMCVCRIRHYSGGGWLCSWQRALLVWTYYNKI